MKHQRIVMALCILIQASLSHGEAAEQEPAIEHGFRSEGEGNLFPGESISYREVTLTWEIADYPGQATDSLGVIHLTSAKPEVPDYAIEIRLDPSQDKWERVLYFDDAVFWIRGEHWRINDDAPATIQQMRIRQAFQPAKQLFTAAPIENVPVIVAANTPIQLNEWKVCISEDSVQYPDGNDYLEITFENTIDGATGTLPAVADVTRKFGRFAVTVVEVRDVEKTVVLKVDADEDTTARGGDRYVSEKDTDPSTIDA